MSDSSCENEKDRALEEKSSIAQCGTDTDALISLTAECVSLIALSIAAIFLAAVAYGFFVYSQFSLPFFLAVASSLVSFFFALFYLPERCARICMLSGEPTLALKILTRANSIEPPRLGQYAAGSLGRLATLAECHLRLRNVAVAQSLFEQVLARISEKKSPPAWPTRAEKSLKVYHRYLVNSEQSSLARSVADALAKLRRQTFPAKVGLMLLPLPVVAYVGLSEVAVRSIAARLLHGDLPAVKSAIQDLARIDSAFFGPGMGAKVYFDYASTLKDTCGDSASALWCAQLGLRDLRTEASSPLAARLYTLAGAIYLEKGEVDEAAPLIQKAAVICETNKGACDWKHAGKTFSTLADLEVLQGKTSEAERDYLRAIKTASPEDKSSHEFLSLLERASSLQSSISISRAIETKKQLCQILMQQVSRRRTPGSYTSDLEEHRRLTRELDACASLLKEDGRIDEAKSYSERAATMRCQRVKPLLLGKEQQNQIVDTATRTTNMLLLIKYRAGGWHKCLTELRTKEFTSKRMLGAMENIPWLFPCDPDGCSERRKVQVDMSAMKVRNSQEPNEISVDVSGTVRILDEGERPDDEHFAFAYLLKREAGKQLAIDSVEESEN